MPKTLTKVLLLAAIMLLAPGAQAMVFHGKAGTLATMLKDKVCDCTGDELWGCYAYLHYRIDYMKIKSDAHSTCYWVCDEVKDDKPEGFLQRCEKGCNRAYEQDKP